MPKRKVILVTDGDQIAKEVLELVAKQIGGRCISLSSGNPTPLSGPMLVALIQQTPYDPVLVMFDDCGNAKEGMGERALRYVASHPDIQVLGVIAVASNCTKGRGTPIHMAVDLHGQIVSHCIDKDGQIQKNKPLRIYGDTVEVLNHIQVPIVIGIGDIGKMRRKDHVRIGAPITTKAVQLILNMYR
ncbi:stage V sporulation protein AE [Thermoflavimicrobium dichotomicum]|uniref:Stage V sporulation protein AE n=1 Tax=Thermoflavimicrobium dichotomicum TaxID=46223 RepID=A0A1I3Q2Y4_9BACL|nr:stage V sporulation protein AE [Thermoflavimicrobium dichotomicum]SFJ28564.1 stage V sporulation protein AE [Thermoflavimicrobium dichotomicum]